MVRGNILIVEFNFLELSSGPWGLQYAIFTEPGLRYESHS